MQFQSTRVACRAHVRARVAACVGEQRGDSLIEVLMAALLVALIATAIFTGYSVVGGIAGGQRSEEQAATLAQQDQARLRGLTIAQLSGTPGNQSTTSTIDGRNYTVVSSSQFVSGGSGGAACTTSGGSTGADEVQTTSTVSWSPSNGRPPVIIRGLITPSEGGSVVVAATDASGAALAGVTATLTGPTTAPPLTTDASGCAVFAGLAGGTYTVAFSDPANWLDVNGNAPVSQTVTVIPTQTASTQPVELAAPGAIQVSFTTFYNGSLHTAATADTFLLQNSGMAPTPRVYGTDSTSNTNTYATTITTPTNLFPFTGTGGQYVAYTGGCTGDGGTGVQTQSVNVTSGTATPLTLALPAMIVLVYTGTPASPGTLLTTKPNITVADNNPGCTSNVDWPQEQIPTATQGALLSPGEPYGNFTVCADNGSVKNSGTVANTSYTQGNAVSIYLGTGAPNRQNGTCP